MHGLTAVLQRELRRQTLILAAKSTGGGFVHLEHGVQQPEIALGVRVACKRQRARAYSLPASRGRPLTSESEKATDPPMRCKLRA